MKWCFSALFCLALLAADRWTVDDILLQEQAGSMELSRDGRMAVFTKSRIDKEKGESVSHLWLKRFDEAESIQLTRGQDSATSPKFSPSGRLIAFLSSRRPAGAGTQPAGGAQGTGEPAGQQIWLMDTSGGEPWQLTRFERGVRAFDWISDDQIAAAAPEDPSLYDQRIREAKDTSRVVDDEEHEPPVRLFRVAVKGGRAERITTNRDRITSVDVSPDGQWALTVHNRSLAEIYNQKIKPATFLTRLSTGESVELFTGQKLYPRSFHWKPDSKSFYFTAPYTTHPYLFNASITKLYHFPMSMAEPLAAAAKAKPVEVPLDWENALAASPAITPDGFVALLANGARNRVARYYESGNSWRREWVDEPDVHQVLAAADGSRIVYVRSNASTPPVFMAARLAGNRFEEPKPFVETNENFRKKTIAKTEVIRWKGALNDEIEGILYYPHHYEPGKKYPLVVMIHGGPHGHDADAFRESWAYPHQLYAQRGAFILKPNYHGSSNYGLKFGESISGGKYNDLEWIDVEKGVDHLIAKGLVDPEKLGVMGWSNGSIISIELSVRTTRYKAVGAGAGDVNWTSDWGNAVFGDAFEQYYLGKTPMDDPDFYVKKSPLFKMDRVTSPTIIFFGTEDRQVPTEQGWQHYRALQHYGKAPVRFILFPGEAHSLRKYVHQKRKVEEELAWFDRYLFGTASAGSPSLKPGSPLDALDRLRKAGEIPETVDRGSIAVGRFEVTRAQFRAFDPSYSVPAGTEMLPATSVSFEKAQQYCEWLSKKTGRKYRLGTEEELSSLLTRSRNENTLDYWAGYAVNFDDAARLKEFVDQAGAGALLRPVGSFAGSGDDPLFDLGGNAAEWVVGKDGKGKVLGGSADQPADQKAPVTSRPDYIGFRVVLEK
ncbi:MAG: prolyl oligopeptidase family serine peptidase [Bryobacteraceae bacterium]|nr:prolyl oligopeptidase family serine peptidase [Bryobacteraceae bacterium]